jgi:hypothetical protein
MVWGTPMSIGDLQFGGVRLSDYAIMLSLTCYGSYTEAANTSKDRLFGAERIVKKKFKGNNTELRILECLRKIMRYLTQDRLNLVERLCVISSSSNSDGGGSCSRLGWW